MASRARRWLERWGDFWFAEGNALALGLFRALFAFALLLEVPVSLERNRFAIEGGFHLPYLSWIEPVSPGVFWALHALQVPFILLLGVGLLSRLSCGALLGLQGYIFFSDQLNFRNHPYFFLLLLLLLLISPCDEALSLRALLRGLRARRLGRAITRAAAPLTAQRLIQLQISLVYLYAALQKLNPEFLGGWVLMDTFRWSLREGRAHELLLKLFSMETLVGFDEWLAVAGHLVPFAWATVVAELFLAWGLWMRRTRPAALAVGVGQHVSIALSMTIDSFTLATLAAYLLFLDPETLPRVRHRLAAAIPGGAGRRRTPSVQNSTEPGTRGKGITSRMLAMPVMNWTIRSKPRPKPAWGTEPWRRRSRYHQ